MKTLAFISILAAALSCAAQQALPRAHAHNDYEHPRPLLDALAQGFGSVEADVYPIDGELLVAHDRDKVRPDRTLEKLYLAPLKERFDQRKEIVPGLKTLILLIDIKSDGLLAYQTLERQIEKYKPMLTVFEGDEIKTNAVTIILSGDRPRAHLAKQNKRWAAIDGRLPDLTNNPPRTLVPLVSDSWLAHFKWREGTMSTDEAARVRDAVSKAHEQGRLIRFWAVPDRLESWKLLHDAEVDLINTDRLEELAAFLRTKSH